jgi:hypothetical protein
VNKAKLHFAIQLMHGFFSTARDCRTAYVGTIEQGMDATRSQITAVAPRRAPL